jgi:predicted lipoprotein with Yx(FWY)xxD motif
MDGSGECAGIRSQLGVYLTGSIAPADRAVVVRHLAACEECRKELAGLASLPALLRRPSSQAAAQSPPDGAPESGDGVPESADGGTESGDAGTESGDAGPESGEALLGRLLRSVTRRRRRRRWRLAAAACLLVALAGLGWALRLTGPATSGTDTAGSVLGTERVDGVTLLTDDDGYTLYWFGPDTPTKSACNDACARQFRPLTGPAIAGTGVTGVVGTIERSDGSLQATYDGHPLYAAAVDSGPGQTRGNGTRADGGAWHEVTAGRQS